MFSLSNLSRGKSLLNIVFCGFNSKAEMSLKFPKTLEGFGYAFNAEGKLRKINEETGQPGDDGFEFDVFNGDRAKNQERYDALGEVVTEHVYKLLEENGMHRIPVPDDLPTDEASFVFCNKKVLEKPNKLLILIHGSGVVRAGQWSRSLIINHSVDHGTQLPYIKKGIELGYDILVMNTNDNYRIVGGKEKMIRGSGSPTEHAVTVWENFVVKSNPTSVGIVAHSYGGVVTMELARKYPDFFRRRVFAIGLTDSVHSLMRSSLSDLQSHLRSIGRNWITSTKPLDEQVRAGEDIPCYSAGHTKHEWTSWSCMSALFDFFEKKYSSFEESQGAKKPKIDL